MTIGLPTPRLVNIRHFEVSGRIRGAFDENDPPDLTPDGPDVTAHLNVNGTQFTVRFRAQFATTEYHLIADLGAEYELQDAIDEEPDEAQQELLRAFATTSSILHLYPFLRESLRASAVRIEVDVPVLPLMVAQAAADEAGAAASKN